MMTWRTLRGALLALAVGAAAPVDAAERLTIGRQATVSVTADIAERVVTEAARRAGIDVVFRRLPLARTIEAADDGELDGDLQRIESVIAGYANLVRVPTPVNEVVIAVYGLSPTLLGKTRAEIEAMRIGHPRGTPAFARHLTRAATVVTPSAEAAVEALQGGRIDVVLFSYVGVEQQMAEGRLPRLVRWPHAWAAEPAYLVLHRRHAALVPRFDAALRSMQREGLIERYRSEGMRQFNIAPLTTEHGAAAPARRR